MFLYGILVIKLTKTGYFLYLFFLSEQDYFGRSLTETNCSRMMLFSVAQAMDRVTNDNDWSIYEEPFMAPMYVVDSTLISNPKSEGILQ